MKELLSIILALVLLVAIGSSAASGTMAGFFDTEVSTLNRMHAGTLNLVVDGQDEEAGDIIQPFYVELTPDKPWCRVVELCNSGTLPGIASIHLYDVLGNEDAPGVGIGTSEPELAAEEALTPIANGVYATDDGTATGTPLLGADTADLENFILVTMWWDENSNGTFENDERIELNQGGDYTLPLSEVDCNVYELGPLPADYPFPQGGGWGSYFAYYTDSGELVMPLIAGQIYNIGTVTVWYDAGNQELHVEYETVDGWTMTDTKVYAAFDPPLKGAPGKFPYKHEGLGNVTIDEHIIPIGPGDSDTPIYIAAHADVWDTNPKGETAWAKGKCRKLKLCFLFPDIPEGDLGFELFDENDPNELMFEHWPTNAYQGDYCTFNISYMLENDC